MVITLSLDHEDSPKSNQVSGEETFVSLKPECRSRGVRNRYFRVFKQAASTTARGH